MLGFIGWLFVFGAMVGLFIAWQLINDPSNPLFAMRGTLTASALGAVVLVEVIGMMALAQSEMLSVMLAIEENTRDSAEAAINEMIEAQKQTNAYLAALVKASIHLQGRSAEALEALAATVKK